MGDKKRILIIDDNLQNVKVLGHLLRDKGYRISIAESGIDAIKNVTQVDPDLILLDIIMPGLNGFETCIELKKIEGISKVPVIFLSALKDSNNKIEGFNAGGVDYLSKPIDSGELFARVNTHLTLSRLQSQLEDDLKLKDKLIEEINTKTEELVTTQKQLVESQKIASLGYLVTGMAHELNTPLSIGITSSSFINQKIGSLHNSLKEENLHAIKDIIDSNNLLMSSLQKLDNLVKDFKKLSIEQLYSEKKDFHIKKLIDDSITVSLHALNVKGIKVEINGEELVVNASFPEALERIIGDLTKNSVIHGFKDREDNIIVINLTYNSDNIVIDYFDNGIGIPDSIKENIFDPFFSTNKSKGSGLGLSVAYNITTQKLNGTINYVDDSKGCHFNLTIPKVI